MLYSSLQLFKVLSLFWNRSVILSLWRCNFYLCCVLYFYALNSVIQGAFAEFAQKAVSQSWNFNSWDFFEFWSWKEQFILLDICHSTSELCGKHFCMAKIIQIFFNLLFRFHWINKISYFLPSWAFWLWD
jgi:hypothetical protein